MFSHFETALDETVESKGVTWLIRPPSLTAE